MKLINYTLIAMLAVFIVQACSPSPQRAANTQLDNLPHFITNPPQDTDEYLYATGSAISSRRNVAQQQAFIQARAEMAQKLSVKVESLQKLFEEEVTSGDRANYSAAFTSASQLIASQELTGAGQHEVAFQAMPDGRIEAFVLARMPVGAARSALENALSREEEMYVRFKESKAFEELQQNLHRLGLD